MDSFVGLFGPDVQENGSSISKIPNYLPPEDAEGNVEYKLKLVNPSKSRFEHLVTQMKWRLREGQGEAIYTIGVSDAGQLIGLDELEMKESKNTLYRMAEKLGADVAKLSERCIDDDLSGEKKTVVEFLVRKMPDDQKSLELRVAVLGSSDVGKSTLLGVLTQGERDNGHGSARLNLFRHLHEIQSGRTSSISYEILGFDSEGSAMTYSKCRTAEEICDNSKKLITFIDLAGQRKYLKTTIFGLTGHSPHLAMLVLSGVNGLPGIAREHLKLATLVDIPIIVVINKTDIASPASIKKTLWQLQDFVVTYPHYKKTLFQVHKKDDALKAAGSFITDKTTPIFFTSCVTGKGLDFLYTFFSVLPPTVNQNDRELMMKKPSEFQIDETFHVPEVGIVVSGLLTSGVINEGDSLNIGPSDSGTFYSVKVSSLHRHKIPCRTVRSCESATVALSCNDIVIRKGMVLISPHIRPPVCNYFQAKIQILFHETNISTGFQASIHIGNIRQTAEILGIMGKSSLSENDTGSVLFKFVQRPECVHPGSKLLLRVGHTKAIGHVTQIFLLEDSLPLKVSPIHGLIE